MVALFGTVQVVVAPVVQQVEVAPKAVEARLRAVRTGNPVPDQSLVLSDRVLDCSRKALKERSLAAVAVGTVVVRVAHTAVVAAGAVRTAVVDRIVAVVAAAVAHIVVEAAALAAVPDPAPAARRFDLGVWLCAWLQEAVI